MKMLKLMALFLITINTAVAEKMTYEEVHQVAFKAVTNYFSYIDTLEAKDIKSFCPNYETLSSDERQTFFAHLLTGISYYESSFIKNTSFTENSGVDSIGLIGLSFKATQAKSYQKNGCYVIKTAEDILDPEKSMRCAMAIIETWMRNDEVISAEKKTLEGETIYLGAARYWSTLRNPYEVTLRNYNNRVVTVGKRKLVIAKIKENYKMCF